MNKIPTICFEDIYEFCEAMDSEFNRRYYASKSDESVDISIFAKYDNARKIINILTDYDYELANINFHDPEIDGYEDEFIITLCARISNHDTPEIWVEPASFRCSLWNILYFPFFISRANDLTVCVFLLNSIYNTSNF